MARDGAAPVLGALAVLALVVADRLPALRGAPVIFMVTAAAVQIDRELAGALARTRRYPSAPVMNFLTAIVVLHVAYFRTPAGSTFLELVNTILLAMLVLVVVAAVSTDVKVHGYAGAFRDLLLSVGISALFGGGLSCALLVQARPAGEVTQPGTLLVALLLAAGWLGLAVGRVVEARGAPEPGYRRCNLAGKLARLLVPVVVMGPGYLLLGATAGAAGATGAGLGLCVGLGLVLGYQLVRALALRCEVTSFRYNLPRQIEFLQPTYDRLFAGGLTDYVGPLVLVYPLALAFLHWTGR